MVKCSIIHLYLYGILKRSVENGNIILLKDIHAMMKWFIKFPKKYHNTILKEMVCLGLLKRRDRETYEIITIINKNYQAPSDGYGEPLW